MSDELKELIKQQVSYYSYHTIESILVKHSGFVVDDYKKLLAALEKEISQ